MALLLSFLSVSSFILFTGSILRGVYLSLPFLLPLFFIISERFRHNFPVFPLYHKIFKLLFLEVPKKLWYGISNGMSFGVILFHNFFFELFFLKMLKKMQQKVYPTIIGVLSLIAVYFLSLWSTAIAFLFFTLGFSIVLIFHYFAQRFSDQNPETGSKTELFHSFKTTFIHVTKARKLTRLNQLVSIIGFIYFLFQHFSFYHSYHFTHFSFLLMSFFGILSLLTPLYKFLF